MHRSLLLGLLLALGPTSSALAQEAPPSLRHQSPTPWYLPRGAFLGTYLRNGAAVAQARLQWQLTLFQDKHDALVFVVDGGVGRSYALPSTAAEGFNIPFTGFYEHTVMVGGAYRNQSPSGWHWGFQVAAGPVWYAAHYQGLANEDKTGGLLEGRLQIGYRVGQVALGLAGGYAEPFSVGRRSVARNYVGGGLIGFFADWR